ncbi:MAG: BON domain-containing protein [Acidobacteriaceae bacterium]
MTHKFRFHLSALPLALVALVCMSVGCSKKTTDAQLAATVQKQLAADTALASQQISVEAKDGTVTLTGAVSDATARLVASKDASAVEGVRTVVNNLTASGAAEPSAGEASTGQPQQSVAAAAAPAPPAPAPRAPARSAPAPRQTAAAPVPAQSQSIVVPTGTRIRIQLAETLSSKSSQTGNLFSGTVVDPIRVNGQTAIPAGARARGVVTEAKSLGRFKGEATLAIRLDSVSIKGQTYSVRTSRVERVEQGKGKRSAIMTGGGAGLGALIGGLAGGGKGALIGGLVGGGGGAAGGALTGNKDLVLPAESVVTFVLQNSVTVNP